MRTLPVPEPPGPAGVYLHFPFCVSRCTYCDFPTVVGQDDRVERYLDALVREVGTGQDTCPTTVDTIYLGGGTPSRMEPRQLERVLGAVRRRFRVLAGAEVSIECNPESLTADRLAGYRDAGATRVSIGVQTLEDRVLASVRRAHDGGEALRAVERARAVDGLEVGVDLIAGLPGDDPERWLSGLGRLLALEPDHLSFYLLETDKEAPLAHAIRQGRVAMLDEDRLADLYEAAVVRLAEAGLELYEISNFARDGRVSRHNLKYWTDHPYAGFGLGAHGYHAGARRGNDRRLDPYLAAVERGADPAVERDPWDRRRRVDEALFLGLRLRDGLDLALLGGRYGLDLRRTHAGAWREAGDEGLIEWNGDTVRLTPRGRLLSNAVFVRLLSDA